MRIVLIFSFILAFFFDYSNIFATKFGPINCIHSGAVVVNGATYYGNFSCSGINYGTGYLTSGAFPAINNTFFFLSEKKIFSMCYYTATTATTKTNFTCLASPDVLGNTGATGATGATGLQGQIGATGATGAMGLSVYDLAVAFGYTGSEVDYLLSLKGAQGATGTIDFSTLSGSINLQNVVNLPTNDAQLETEGYYFAITRQKEGVTYIDWIGVRNIIFVILTIWILSKVWRFVNNDNKKNIIG